MAWAKFDDALADHPKTLDAGNEAFGVYVRSILYCAKQLTDGRLPASWVESAAGDNAASVTATLVAVRFWEQIPTGYLVHDYLDHQPTRDEVLDQRRKAAQRKAQQRARTAREGDDLAA